MSSPIGSEALFNAQTRVLTAQFFTDLQGLPAVHSQVINSVSDPDSNRGYFDAQTMAGFGTMPQVREHEGITLDAFEEAYRTRIVKQTYGLGYVASKQLTREDVNNIIPQLNSLLAKSASETVEIKVHSMFNQAFNAAVLGADSKSLCASDHPLKKGGTQSNLLANAALTATSLESLLIKMRLIKGDSGFSAPRDPVYIASSVYKQRKIEELLKSKLNPENAENAIGVHGPDNTSKMRPRLIPFISRYITSTTAYFVLAKKAPIKKDGSVKFDQDSHKLCIIWKWKPEYDSFVDQNTKGRKTLADQRFGYGWLDWRGFAGSQGA